MAEDLRAFEDALDRLGPNIEAWPAPRREAARGLLARESSARSALMEAKRLEALLSEALPATMPPRLQAVLASIPAGSPARGWRPVPSWPAGPRLAWGAGMAAVLAASMTFGLLLGAGERASMVTAIDDDTLEMAGLAYPQLPDVDEDDP